MPYSPPTANSVDFNFVTPPSYTPPAGTVVNFNFQETVSNNLVGVHGTGTIGSFSSQVRPPLTGVFASGLANPFAELDFGGSATLDQVTASGQAGTFAVDLTSEPALTGVFGTGMIGILAAANTAVPLDPVFCTGEVGTILAVRGLDSVFCTGHAGTFGKEVDVGLTGVFGRGIAGVATIARGALFPTTATGTGVANDFGVAIEAIVSVLLVGVSGQGIANDFAPNVTSLPKVSCMGIANDFVQQPRVFQSGVPVITAGM